MSELSELIVQLREVTGYKRDPKSPHVRKGKVVALLRRDYPQLLGYLDERSKRTADDFILEFWRLKDNGDVKSITSRLSRQFKIPQALVSDLKWFVKTGLRV